MKKKNWNSLFTFKKKHIDCLLEKSKHALFLFFTVYIKYKKSETNNLFIEPKQSTINCTLIKRIKR